MGHQNQNSGKKESQRECMLLATGANRQRERNTRQDPTRQQEKGRRRVLREGNKRTAAVLADLLLLIFPGLERVGDEGAVAV
jgi:hypothetical protein